MERNSCGTLVNTTQWPTLLSRYRVQTHDDSFTRQVRSNCLPTFAHEDETQLQHECTTTSQYTKDNKVYPVTEKNKSCRDHRGVLTSSSSPFLNLQWLIIEIQEMIRSLLQIIIILFQGSSALFPRESHVDQLLNQ